MLNWITGDVERNGNKIEVNGLSFEIPTDDLININVFTFGENPNTQAYFIVIDTMAKYENPSLMMVKFDSTGKFIDRQSFNDTTMKLLLGKFWTERSIPSIANHIIYNTYAFAEEE